MELADGDANFVERISSESSRANLALTKSGRAVGLTRHTGLKPGFRATTVIGLALVACVLRSPRS